MIGVREIIGDSITTTVEAVEHVLELDYHVEIDVRLGKDNQLWMGHDKCEVPIPDRWFNIGHIWWHCKTVEAFLVLEFHAPLGDMFFHDGDDMALTWHNRLWLHPNYIRSDGRLTKKAIVVSNDIKPKDLILNYVFIDELKKCYAICTDFPNEMMELIHGK
jgi:hypothetical protein